MRWRTELPGWAVVAAAAGMLGAAIGVWFWSVGIVGIASDTDDARFDELAWSPWVIFGMYAPKIVFGLLGFGALAVTGWRTRAIPRLACGAFALAALLSVSRRTRQRCCLPHSGCSSSRARLRPADSETPRRRGTASPISRSEYFDLTGGGAMNTRTLVAGLVTGAALWAGVPSALGPAATLPPTAPTLANPTESSMWKRYRAVTSAPSPTRASS